MNDTHAYFDIYQEMFWKGVHAEYRPEVTHESPPFLNRFGLKARGIVFFAIVVIHYMEPFLPLTHKERV